MSIRFNKKRNRKPKTSQKKHIGEIRKSQLMNTFGVGSMVDFVRDTAMIGGVDDWNQDDSAEYRKISNENLQALTGAKFFLEPKTSDGNKYLPVNQDIRSYAFPQKLYCPVCKNIISYRELISNSNRHVCPIINEDKGNKKCRAQLVASRFVIICPNGHIDDFPYSWWVHHGQDCSSGKPAPRIRMFNIGDRSDAESLMLECTECKAKRSMSGVFNKNALSENDGYACTGRHPHLGESYRESCDLIPTVRLRSSSSVYFPVNYSALLIPPWSQEAIHRIEREYNRLQYMPDENKRNYIKDEILPKCHRLNLEDLLSAYETIKNRRENHAERNEADIFQDEYRILCQDGIDEERYSSHFVPIPADFAKYFDIVSVLDQLVVTLALKGFTRLYPYKGGSEEAIAPLSREHKEWLPAVELNGEGIFIKFNDAAIDSWCELNADRYAEMSHAHEESFLKSPKFSAKYVLLHSFAHLLIRQLANECGYSAASINEKIYSDFTDGSNLFRMNGILIYLSSPDSDGSLGGLVSVAEETDLLDKVLKNMLAESRWCSSDPLCSSAMHQGFASLNYAACHACTLLPETSCEIQNVLLDRVSVTGKPEKPEIGFFGDLIINN